MGGVTRVTLSIRPEMLLIAGSAVPVPYFRLLRDLARLPLPAVPHSAVHAHLLMIAARNRKAT